MALGELRFLPWEFERLTPHEFFLAVDGLERNWKRLARLLAWAAQSDYKTALTPEIMLHGQPKPRSG